MTSIRFAVFNIRELTTEILANTGPDGAGIDSQACAAAEIIGRVRPDVLLICEIDYDYTEPGLPLDLNAKRFADHYLAHCSNPIAYPHRFAAPCNTGILSGIDLDGDGYAAKPADQGEQRFANDCYGWGLYPGQYSMALLSRYPFKREEIRTFQELLWKDFPNSRLPADFYTEAAAKVLRLSSKSHWDVPIDLGGGRTINAWCCHPTPQGFDGAEGRNARRNFDEIRFWQLYAKGAPFPDDAGVSAPRAENPFVLLGDLNSAPGEIHPALGENAIDLVLEHDLFQETGALTVASGALRGRAPGPPSHLERHTIGHRRTTRFDYVLPASGLTVNSGGVFWPSSREDLQGAVLAMHASDHRLVWVDIEV